jgi:hypothetical protein
MRLGRSFHREERPPDSGQADGENLFAGEAIPLILIGQDLLWLVEEKQKKVIGTAVAVPITFNQKKNEILILYAALDIMSYTMAAAAFTAKLIQHGLSVWNAMASLALWNLTVGWVAEGTSLFGMTSIRLHQSVIDCFVATGAALFGLILTEGKVQRFMRIGVTPEAIRILQPGTMSLGVVAVKA